MLPNLSVMNWPSCANFTLMSLITEPPPHRFPKVFASIHRTFQACKSHAFRPTQESLPAHVCLNYMTQCHNCGREIGTGTVCPYCGAPNDAVPFAAATQITAPSAQRYMSPTLIIVGLCVLVYLAMVFTGTSPLSPTRE